MPSVVRCDGPLLNAIRYEHLDTVDGACLHQGGEDLPKPGLVRRQRKRLTLVDETGHKHLLYMKFYGREKLLEALRRWRQTGVRVSRAMTELGNIDGVRKLGIPTMEALVCVDEPSRLGRGRGFLIVTTVPGEALSRCMDDYLRRHADSPERVEHLTDQLADLVATLHGGGYVHRDLYTPHVFLEESESGQTLYLIDLARVFRPRWRRFRWRVKDLAQLKYSMPAEWVSGHWERFLDGYFGGQTDQRAAAERAIDRKADWMRRRTERKTGGRRRK